MSEHIDIPETVKNVIRRVVHDFCLVWDEETASFPDTEEGVVLTIVSLKCCILSIVATYLQGFDPKGIPLVKEALIKEIRDLDMNKLELYSPPD